MSAYHEYMQKMERYWNDKNYVAAVSLFDLAFLANPDRDNTIAIHYNTNLCSAFIDIADLFKMDRAESDQYLADAIIYRLNCVIEFYKKHLPQIRKIYPGGIADYNYANALSTTYSLLRIKEPQHLLPQNSELLVKAKRQFWIAIRAAGKENQLAWMTNLAHVLSDCRRITEAIYLYDQVLVIEKEFPQANFSKAKSLDYLRRLADQYSINLFCEAYDCARAAALTTQACHPSVKEDALLQTQRFLNILNQLEYDWKNYDTDKSNNTTEFLSHSNERQFYIKNGMSLSEHSIYCGCRDAKYDDLSIIKQSGSNNNDDTAPYEHILRQLKTEYYKAREAFYNASNAPDSFYDTKDRDIGLGIHEDGVITGTRMEDFRLSFKACYGVLDKIALAVCSLYQLPIKNNEKIYFESFWKKSKMEDHSVEKERWDKINSTDKTPSLFALYFQATDLNSESGEWREFKKWRNSLEHGLFILKTNSPNEFNAKVFHNKIPITAVDYDLFKDRSAELLRFVRSAIFYYAFTVRQKFDVTDSTA